MKKILKVILIIVVVIALGLWYFVNSLKPQYSGNLKLKGLNNKVEVYYDTYGIPHIYAQNQHDAYMAFGYVHAQDRLWQMEVIRRIAPGRLSELFGKDLIKNDKFFKGLSIDDAADSAIRNLDKNSEKYKLTMAYLEGINQFVDNGPTPIEYFLTGAKKTHFNIHDVYNVFGYMSFSFAMAQKSDPFFTEMKSKLGSKYLNELGFKTNPNSTLIHNNYQNVSSDLAAAAQDILQKLPLAPFIGSNSWVVGPSKTKSGKVLFSNDPHIGFSQPAVWYEAYIKTPNYEMYGYHLAGVPFPLLGHNRKIAYGLTMFENDDLDFYTEKVNPDNPNQYKTPNGWQNFKVKTKTIKVKNGNDIKIKVRYTEHGPILNDVLSTIKGKTPVAMNWIYTKFPIKSIDAMYAMSHATNIQEFQKGAALIHSPGLNVMYGDADNNIAWWAAGKLYTFKNKVNTKLILDGANADDNPNKYLNFSKNPQAINPPWGYVYSANNQPDSIVGELYPGYYLPEDRAKRIVSLISAKNDWDRVDFEKMITDVTSAVTPGNVAVLEAQIKPTTKLSEVDKEALKILKNWDGSNTLKSVAPTIYFKWVYKVMHKTFADELGEKGFKQFMLTDVAKRQVTEQIQTEKSIWWDNVLTKNVKETRQSILVNAFKETISDLVKQLGPDITKWTWDRVHTLEHVHAVTIKAPFLRKYLNVGPFKVPGAREVINNLMFKLNDSGLYPVDAGPSTRRIVDFSDVEKSVSILPTGESGNPLSAHYKDQAKMYVNGQFRPMLMNEKVIKNLKDKLVLSPK